ncbi:MAG TPA: Fe-S cluster assembly ATPase SufC [Candidatus Azoamicus sp. MARI]
MTKFSMLEISNLNVNLKEKKILTNLNIKINNGETHILMGPNGAGKSTLANILIGNFNEYNITGSIIYNKTNLFTLSQEEIAIKGIFLSFQHPIEIPGLSNYQFFKSFINNKRKYNKLDPMDNAELLNDIKKNMNILKINEDFINRNVNENFSGGEKKRNEILQMLLLNPNLIILDEIDSGLDVDSIKHVFDAINSFKNKNNSFLIITHYSKILDYTSIDAVHVLYNGTIIKTGEKKLALEIDKNGYSNKKLLKII